MTEMGDSEFCSRHNLWYWKSEGCSCCKAGLSGEIGDYKSW